MILDTNILIAHLQGDEDVVQILSKWKLSGRIFSISTITRAEVLARPDLSALELAKTISFLEDFESIPFSDPVADIAGEIRRHYRIALPDAAIAATALFTGTPLVTRNYKDFRRITGLNLLII